MPTTLDPLYAQWLTQHGQVRSNAVNVLEFVHLAPTPAFAPIYVSDYGEEFKARLETGVDIVARALGFTIDGAVDNLTTEQRVIIRMDAVNGAVMDQFRALSMDDLQSPVQIVHRAYMDTKRSAPVMDPLLLYVTQLKATRVAVEIEASIEPFPNVSTGKRYLLEHFPTLAYL